MVKSKFKPRQRKANIGFSPLPVDMNTNSSKINGLLPFEPICRIINNNAAKILMAVLIYIKDGNRDKLIDKIDSLGLGNFKEV